MCRSRHRAHHLMSFDFCRLNEFTLHQRHFELNISICVVFDTIQTDNHSTRKNDTEMKAKKLRKRINSQQHLFPYAKVSSV